MSNIGNLYFKIGGDDKELRKILQDRKKDAVELESILSKMKLGSTSPNKELSNSLKLQEQINKLTISNTKAEIAKNNAIATSLINEQRVNNEISKGSNLRLQNLRLDNDRITSEQRIRTETERTALVKKQQELSAARISAIEKERTAKDLLNQQRLRSEIERTEAIRKRAALIGTEGQNSFNNSLLLTNRTLFSQKALLSQISSQLGMYFSVYQLGRFVKELAMVSGEFEKQRLALTSILQDKEAANRIFEQVKDLAVYSPFNFKELTDYAKQLSAFSIPANELFDTMKRLADVSAGLGVDMRRIILAYGQIRSAAFLRGYRILATHGSNAVLNTPLIAGNSLEIRTISSEALAA